MQPAPQIARGTARVAAIGIARSPNDAAAVSVYVMTNEDSDTMSLHTRMQTWAVGALSIVAFASSTFPALHGAARPQPATAATHLGATTPRAAFAWPGVFDLVGTGFPDGERRAVVQIARSDTSYSLVSLQGPPGALVRFRVAGDSAHVVWNLGGGEMMVVDLHGRGDSLSGEWTSGDWTGPIRGVRRP